MGEPALADGITSQFYALSVRQARIWTLVIFLSLALAVVVILVPGSSDMELLSPAVIGLTVGVAQAAFLRPGFPLAWRAATRPLLAGQPWRETPVRVLNTNGTVLYLYSGEYIRVREMPPAVREVVVRAGRVWLVGPDAKGRLAVRVDGTYVAWPAKRIPPLQGTAALPSNEPIAGMTARLAVGRLRSAVVIFPVVVALNLLIAVLDAVIDGKWWFFAPATVYTFVAVLYWRLYRTFKHQLPTEPWVQAAASEPSWQARWNGTAIGTVVLDLPDGRRFTAHLDRAPLDLFVNVAREKTLWIASNGVVGFPQYPSVARARLRATPIPVPPVPSAG